ncbi:SusE domain-containing protein [Flavobacterium sp.]|uniref:SusE domain-containing protein n=1 Tax=Flavobacterium sp. TaxID=239 RepID=UPI00262B8309|nr:SusE domain-containing protein [Flavobacterium sp.]
MKNISLKAFALSAVALSLTSCEDDSSLLISEGQAQFRIIAPVDGDAIFLDKDYPNNPALTVSWEDAVYNGAPTQVNYSIEVDKDGDNFDSPYVLGTSTGNSLTFKVSELNTAAATIGLAPNALGTMNVRIKATIGTVGAEPMLSNVVNYSVTPYLSYLFKDYYFVGAATAPGWNNNNNNTPLWRNPSNSSLYEFTGYFVGGGGGTSEFKILETLGLWQPQWGTNDGGAQSGALAGNPATQSGDPGVFKITGPSGYYKFSMNMATGVRTFSITPYTGSTSTTYSVIGMIGSAAGGWADSNQINMTPLASDPHVWYANNVALANGELKFRANNGWTVNWGSNTEYSGTGTQGGPNIPVTGTTYNVWFNDLTGQYMLIPASN